MKSAGRRAPSSAARAATPSGWPDWGDAAVISRLREAIRQQCIGHAYLLTGPSGVGKRAIARAFAQAICCEEPGPDDPSLPCGLCRSCRNVERRAHPDVEWFDLESQTLLADKPGKGASVSIETIRAVRSSCALLPVEARKRILIIDDAETLLEPAQEALLKTLEEPPRFVTIVLLSDEPDALLATVRSRCHQLAVSPASEGALKVMLQRRDVPEELASEIAFLTRGRAALALAAVTDGKLLQEKREERDAARTWIASSAYDRLVTAFKLGEQFGKRRKDVVGIVQAVVQLLREEMLNAADNGDARADGERGADMEAGALPWSRAVGASLRCLADLEANVRPRLALQAMVLQWPPRDQW